MREYWPIAFVAVVLAAVLIFVFKAGNPAEPAPEKGHTGADEGLSETQLSEMELFYQKLAEMAPQTLEYEHGCPVCGTKLTVPSLTTKNVFGGVASDYMSIMLTPPSGEHQPPSADNQEWAMISGTCPNCRATYLEVDLYNIRAGLIPGARAALKDWDLAVLAPDLAAKPVKDWTDDDTLFVRYLTMRKAGFPDYELAYYALAASHASKFASWYGDPLTYSAPASAYHALAASLFTRELNNPDSKMIDRERSMVSMTTGELYRLLGRKDDALKWLNNAEGLFETELADSRAALEQADDQTTINGANMFINIAENNLRIVRTLKSHAEQGDFNLIRITPPGVQDPPIGWYIDSMLPAINGHLDQYRNDWNTVDDPAAITGRIAKGGN